jgi:predicted HTH domain antitoxin
MSAQADLVVPKEVLQSAHMSPEEMLIELATHLYEKKRLTMGQAKRLAKLDQISFQKELAKRNIHLHITIEDVMDDMETVRKLRNDRSK